jgi:hypothetical protein
MMMMMTAAETIGPIVIETGTASVTRIVDGTEMTTKTLAGTAIVIVIASDDATTSTAAQGTRLIRLDTTETVIVTVILVEAGGTIKE